jgi:cytochrome o ubiquinol oxidase subunit II
MCFFPQEPDMRHPDSPKRTASVRPPPSSFPPDDASKTRGAAHSVARAAAAGVLVLLGGCTSALLDPKGDIGVQEKHLILVALGLMLLVVIPVILLTLYFAWHFRASNTRATYAPKWSHSTAIEVVVWSIPCVIIVALAMLIWKSTHELDPYRPIVSQQNPQQKPLRVDVVALNWKWLFIYPDYGVASVNQLAIPVDTPVDFHLTAESLMNSFFIPQLGSQVYAMPAMQTQLHLIANAPGTYEGRSSAFSGPGFADMHFDTLATSRSDFDAWIARAKAAPQTLDTATYTALSQPGPKAPVTLYSGVAPHLFDDIVDRYMRGTARDPMCGTHAPTLSLEPTGGQTPATLAAE